MFSANKMLSIGISEIDADHEALNGLAYKIEKAVISGTPMTEIRILAAELQSTIKSHFDKEERILAPYNLPRMAEHKVMHKKVIDDLSALSEAMEDDNSKWRDHLFSIIGDLTQHVILYDMEARGEPVPD